MNLQVTKATRVEVELENLWNYFADHADLEVADRFLASVERTIQHLAEQPGLGHPRRFQHEELAGLHSWRVDDFPNHLIFYRATAETWQIYSVMHGARDPPRRLLDRP